MQMTALSQLIGDALDGTEPSVADVTFADAYTLELGGLTLEIVHPGPAHTPGDRPMEQGRTPGAGMAFRVAGGVTAIPAAMAVWALAKREVFALEIGRSPTGAVASGLLVQLWAQAA
mgnify:CR=1 FL=1